MNSIILLAPVNTSCGLQAIVKGFSYRLKKKGFHPLILQPFCEKTHLESPLDPQKFLNDTKAPLPIEVVSFLLAMNQEDKIAQFLFRFIESHSDGNALILIQGVSQKNSQLFASKINAIIAKTLSAKVILVSFPGDKAVSLVEEQIEMEAENFTENGLEILGCILNKTGAPVDKYGNSRIDLFDPCNESKEKFSTFSIENIPLIAKIAWERSLMGITITTIANHVKASIITKDFLNEQVYHFVIAAAKKENISHIFEQEAMVITSGDRSDVIIACCNAYVQKKPIKGILLTGGFVPDRETMDQCKDAIDKGFAILSSPQDTLRLAISLQNLQSVFQTDCESEKKMSAYISSIINDPFIENLIIPFSVTTVSPAAFKYQLKKKAQLLKKKIILPEGDDIRIIEAANICQKELIADITLLGDEKIIKALAKDHGIDLNMEIEIIDPKTIAANYVEKLVSLRKHKGLTRDAAIISLQDPIIVATMMLQGDLVDGLVAGSQTTTANVLSPALKILKTKEGVKKISSVFFMCLTTEVVLYADCAVNINPTEQDLAVIAIETANTAKAFDIDPIVALISYSTGSSGFGKDVEKVVKANEIIKEKNPDFLCDGPLQYDAASSQNIAKIKAPESFVAGHANVFIFPDLNTANTTYKAVQQSGKALSIGPILQGIAKPVNDLSRGATVDDIVYTIIITAIQANN